MKLFCFITTLFAALTSYSAESTIQPEFVSLTYSPRCILEAVTTKMSVQLKSEVELPGLFPYSTTSFDYFKQKAQASFPKDFEITFYTNLYSQEHNQIYINDSKPFVGENGRTSDEVLAHELAHYIQSKYLGYDKEDATSDAAEDSAIRVQSWFRGNYMDKKSQESPCPETQKQGYEYSKIWKW